MLDFFLHICWATLEAKIQMCCSRSCCETEKPHNRFDFDLGYKAVGVGTFVAFSLFSP